MSDWSINPIFNISVEELREELKKEDELNFIKNFSYDNGLNTFSIYIDNNDVIGNDNPEIFSDKIKILIDYGIEPLKNGERRTSEVENFEYFIALLNKIPAEKLKELDIIINEDELKIEIFRLMPNIRNLELFFNFFNNNYNYNIKENIKNLNDLFCFIFKSSLENYNISHIINYIRYIYDNIYGRNPPRCILDIDLNQEIIDALDREFPPNSLESLNIRLEVPINTENNRRVIRRLNFNDTNTTDNKVIIPTELANVDINNEELSNNFFNFIMEKYKSGITSKFSIQGETGIDAKGISRMVYNKFIEIYYKKYFNEYNGFYMVKFPISEDMKKATEIIISLAEKNNVKFLVPIPTTLYYLLSLPSIETIIQQFNIENIFRNNKINVKLLLPNKKENEYNPNLNKLKNQNAIQYSENILGEDNIKSKIEFIRYLFKKYVGEVNNFFNGNRVWEELNNNEKNKIYFFNYLKYVGIENMEQFNELYTWFQSIPDNIRTNEIKYDVKSIMERVKFIIQKNTNRRLFSPNSNKDTYKNANILYNFLINGTDEDRKKFVEFVSGSHFYTGELKVFIFETFSPRGNKPDFTFNAHTCFNNMDLFNSTEPITTEYIHNVLYGETGIHASN